MKLEVLRQHIRTLASLPETSDPVVSCYVDLTEAGTGWRERLRDRLDGIVGGRTWAGAGSDMAGPISRLWNYMSSPEVKNARGTAVFVREGDQPFWLTLKFSVPVATWVSVDTLPNIYHLVEMQDRYQRYIVLLSTPDAATIYEIVLGEISRQLWLQRPTLRKRVGREWTRVHYQNHQRERGLRFVREKVEILDRLLSADGPAKVILAGDSRLCAELRSALPPRLATAVTSIVPLGRHADTDQVIANTLEAFISTELQSSAVMIERLFNAFYKDDLAVMGVAESLQSLQRCQADALIIKQNSNLGRSRSCGVCGWAVTGPPLPETCMECGGSLSPSRDARAELVRLAELNGCRIETVGESKLLDALGGVGCLLRYSLARRHHLTGNNGRTLTTRAQSDSIGASDLN
jgi:hypothetical protein